MTRIEMNLIMAALREHGRKPKGSHTPECCSEARDLGTVVLNLGGTPEQAVPALKPARMATEPQVRYVANLLEQREVAAYWAKRAQDFLDDSAKQTFDEASKLINMLKTLPKKARQDFYYESDSQRSASPRQIEWCRTLVETKVGADSFATWNIDTLTQAQAREIIDALKDAPKVTHTDLASANYPAGPGVYKLDGQFYMVQVSVHGTGRLMCKELDDMASRFVRTRGMGGGKLTAEHKLSTEKAFEELGRLSELYGHCCACGRTLTDAESKELGIGPICRDKLGF